MGQKVLINVEPEDIRVAILEEGVLTDLFVENRHEKTIVGNIYKGTVMDVIPGIQAAFVDIGLERNAFLHVQDVPPAEGDTPYKTRGRRRNGNSGSGEGKRQNISDYLKPGQKIMVQAIKDGISDKGPRISMYVSLPGRYLVYLPNQDDDDAGGVSRRVEDRGERARLKRVLESIDLGEAGGSMILRTAAVDSSDDAILRDAEFLQTTWERVSKVLHKSKSPAQLHTDYNILYRLARDVFTENIDEIYIDDTEEHANLRKMLQQFLPKLKNKVLVYTNTRNVFEVFDVERQIFKAMRHRVWLRSGGHVVIDECEALTAIDVNTGKFIGKEDQEATVLRTNLEAARVVARQLRLRDIGGIIIIDFIDMRRREHREEVLGELKRCLRQDRARTTASDFTELGIVEMTRKRVRHSLGKTLMRSSPFCGGSGMLLSLDSTWRVVRNGILSVIEDHPDHDVTARIHPEILAHIRERHSQAVADIENEHGIKITFEENADHHPERYLLTAAPHGVKRPKADQIITVEGKRFSGSELDEPQPSRPQRRRRGGRRPEPQAAAPEPPPEPPPEAPEEATDEEATDEEIAEIRDRSSRERAAARGVKDRSDDVPAQDKSEIAEILAMESLSGQSGGDDGQETPEEAATAERSDRDDRTDGEKSRRRRRRRGGRGRRRGREGAESGPTVTEAASEIEGSPAEESEPEAPAAAAAPEADEDAEFTSVDEYLGGEAPEAGNDGDKAERKAPARRRKPAKRTAKKTTAKRKPAKKAAAKKKTAKRTAARKTPKGKAASSAGE